MSECEELTARVTTTTIARGGNVASEKGRVMGKCTEDLALSAEEEYGA